jgi:arylsulfatase
VHEGRLAYCYNLFGLAWTTVRSESALPGGPQQVRMELAYDGGGPGRGGSITLYVDGTPVGQGRVERTVPLIFSADETCDIGRDAGSAVSPEYTPEESIFTGGIEWVQLDVDEAAQDADHLITPEERLALVLARQ